MMAVAINFVAITSILLGSLARRLSLGKPAGDAGRTGGVSEKGTARLGTHALYRPEIDLDCSQLR